MILFNQSSTIHPDKIFSPTVEMLQKSCLMLSILVTPCVGRTGRLTIFESVDEVNFIVTTTMNISEDGIDTVLKLKNCKKEFYKVEYDTISGNGGTITVEANV